MTKLKYTGNTGRAPVNNRSTGSREQIKWNDADDECIGMQLHLTKVLLEAPCPAVVICRHPTPLFEGGARVGIPTNRGFVGVVDAVRCGRHGPGRRRRAIVLDTDELGAEQPPETTLSSIGGEC